MAAILCNGLAQLCQGFGRCLSLPCQLCGDACRGCCKATGQVLASAFAPYLITTLALNIPPSWFGIKSFLDASSLLNDGGGVNRCNGDVWLWVNAALCLIHILAAFYIVNRIQEESAASSSTHDDREEAATTGRPSSTTTYEAVHDESSNRPRNTILFLAASVLVDGIGKPRPPRATLLGNTNNDDDGQANSMTRLKQVLCYDAIVALYIIAAIIWLVWQSMGVSQAFTIGNNNDNNDELCEKVAHGMAVSLTCGFVYCMLVCMAFSCSFLCLRSR